MTKLTQIMIETAAVLGVGLIITAALMFAFARPVEAAEGPHAVGSTLEVIISDSGHAIVRGAEVTAVSGSVITARTMWGDADLTWTITTDDTTEFVERGGRETDPNDIEAGDYISFSGELDESERAFTVEARVVKDWSEATTFAVYTGTVVAIDEEEDAFTIETRNGTRISVSTDEDTTYVGEKDGSIEVGDRLVVSGSYSENAQALSATKVSLNAALTLSPAPKEWTEWMKDMPILKWFTHAEEE